MPDQPYNPLDKLNLADSIERALLEQPCGPLPPTPFEGAGIYALYYSGDFPAYGPISDRECVSPIYVGKAVPPGGRRGGFLNAAIGRVLSARLGQHARSIGEATNLDLADFRCRYLVLDDVWIPLGETLLISHFEPVWNRVVDGFGKHVSGTTRSTGRRSSWDELHPGRPWAALENPARLTGDQLLERIAEFFAGRLAESEQLDGADA